MSHAPAPPPSAHEPSGDPAPDSLKTRIRAALHSFMNGLKTSAKDAPKEITEGTKGSLQGLRSPDWRTRRMSRVFLLCLIGVFVVLGFASQLWWTRHSARKAAAELAAQEAAELAAQMEEERKKAAPPTYQSMGFFSLELREGAVRQKGSMNSAEFEIVIACSTPELCEFIKAHLDLARGELSPLFVPADRDRILSVAGKRAFREEIRDTLNRWVERLGGQDGEVIDVLFPRFIVS